MEVGKVVLLCWLGVFSFLFQQSAFPLPRKLSGGTFAERLDARFSYYWQVFQHVCGLRPLFDKAWLQSKYAKLVPSGTSLESLKAAPAFGQVVEIDAYNDPQWREKFTAMYRDHWTPSGPLVVRGLTHVDSEHFHGMRNWTMDTLKNDIYWNVSIPVFTDCFIDKSLIWMPFEQFSEEINDKSLVRYARCVNDNDRKLVKALNTTGLAFLQGKSFDHKLMEAINGEDVPCSFIGGRHVQSRLHSDFGASTFVEVLGRKRWVFFPPTEGALLYPNGHQHNVAYNADLDIFDVDLEEHHLHGALTGLEVVINPGDVLFFPAFWWHAVQNLDDLTIGVDFAIIDTLSSWKVQTMLLLGSIFNGNMLQKVAYNRLFKDKGSVRKVFFSYYSKDSKDEM
jgi:hypothetical protein